MKKKPTFTPWVQPCPTSEEIQTDRVKGRYMYHSVKVSLLEMGITPKMMHNNFAACQRQMEDYEKEKTFI